MGNLSNKVNLIVVTVDKGMIDEKSLLPILEYDLDFDGEEGVEVSKEIFEEFKDMDDEVEQVEKMIDALFDVPNFIGNSSFYGDYEYNITETEFMYVVSIAFIN